MFKKVADGWIRTRVLWYGRRPIWQMRHNHCPEMIKWLLIKTGLAYLPKVTMFYMIGPTRRRRWPANNKKIRSIFLTFSAFFVTLFASFFVTPDALDRETDKATLSLSFSLNVSLQVCTIQIFSSSLFGKCFFPECDRPRLIYFAPLSASSGSFNY